MEERESKVQAGKDAFLAFQKKKGKKSKKSKSKAASTEDDISMESSMEATNTNNSLGVGVVDSGLVVNDQLLFEDELSRNGVSVEKENDVIAGPIGNANYPHQKEITTLQKSLVAMETTLHNREKEIDELKSLHLNEIANLQTQQEETREKMLQDQAMKFAQEMNQMKEQLSMQFAGNEDEREAQRMRQLKSTLKHIHEEEIEKIQLAHQEEKRLLIEDNKVRLKELQATCDETIEGNKKQLEQMANDQIKQIHSQFMVSYNELMKQKCDIEDEHKRSENLFGELQGNFDQLLAEKQMMEKKVSELEENHSLEVSAIKKASSELERRLKEWKGKASKLQERIEQSEVVQQVPSDHEGMLKNLQAQLQKKDEELSAIVSSQIKEKDKLHEKDKIIAQLEAQLSNEEELSRKKLSEMEENHRSLLSDLESKHAEHVSLLEGSVSESSTSQASLEFAEAHMKELQQQLNAYRNQEMNHKAAMEQAKVDQQEEIAQVRELGEAKCMEMSTAHQQVVDQMKMRISELEDSIGEKEAELQAKLGTVSKEMQQKSTAAIENVIQELTAKHNEKMTELTSQHQLQIENLKANHSMELSSSLEALQQQIEPEKQKLRNEHEADKESTQAHIVNLEMSLQLSEEKLKELRTLQEKTQKLETELRAKEVDLSISQSELNTQQINHSKTKQAMDEYIAKYDEAMAVNVELKNKLGKEQEASQQFEEMLQQKEDQIATHQAHLTSHQLRISDLTEELAQERQVSDSLRKEVEAMSHNSESAVDVSSTEVQNQLAEAKERCSSLMKEWEEKETEQEKLRGELSSTQESLATQEKEYTRKIDSLELQLAQESEALVTATRKLEVATGQLEDKTGERDELQITVKALNVQVASYEEEMKKMKNDTSKQKYLDTIEDLQASNETIIEEFEELKNKATLLTHEKNELMTRLSELELEVSDKDTQLKGVEELQAKLSAHETSFKKMQQHYDEQLSDAESRCQMLQKQISKSQRMEGQMRVLVNTQSDIEKSLVKARQVLIEKLRQKELLEKDLNHHRTQLERRQSEKQRLEELLFEKSRFEQELRNQKDQLQADLDGIERKLKSHSSNGPSTNRTSWLNDELADNSA